MIIYINNASLEPMTFRTKALENYSKRANEDIGKISYNQKGCPMLEKYFVSISNTENVEILAISSDSVGVDIENKNRKITLKDISIEDWTKREAYAKWLGKGLNKSIIFEFKPTAPLNKIDYKNFIIAVCSKDMHYEIVDDLL